MEASAATTPAKAVPPACRYDRHRPSDWIGEGGKRICGICHPRPPADPAPPVDDAGTIAVTAPAHVLRASRVDLVSRIRDGIPPRRSVPGASWLYAGKRYLLPAGAGRGKSLLALVLAVDVVAAGGRVAILDVENGEDEYVRRLADVLAARAGLEDACSQRLGYFEWPSLRVDWAPDEWAASLAGVDLVIFDSSRFILSAAGLDEDSNNDYAIFATALLVPLCRAGATTIVLDNTGHADGKRARGASAKRDLNEVVYVVEAGEPFDRDRAGHLRLIRDRTRFPELPLEFHVPLGGGVYGPIGVAEDAPASDEGKPTPAMERIAEAVAAKPGMTTREVRELSGGRQEIDQALGRLVAEGHVRVEKVGQAHRHHPLKPLPGGSR